MKAMKKILLLLLLPAVVQAQPQMPLDFPNDQPVDAKPGDYVLCPPQEWVVGLAKDPETTLIYYTAHLVTAGPEVSIVKTLSGGMDTIPNAFIIGLGKQKEAAKGDIVLSWWQSGSGMKRLVVKNATTPQTPQCTYLDNGSIFKDKVETLKSGSFNVLTQDWQPGQNVMCVNEGEQTMYVLLKAAPDKLLLMGWAGKILVLPREGAVPIAHKPKLAKGQAVKIAPYATFKDGTVIKVDEEKGMAQIRYSFAGSDKDEWVPFGEIVTTEF